MRWFDPLLFLLGNREAILRIGSSWWALLVAALFVLSAGIARNYDHLAFGSQWEWLYGPFIASLASSLVVAFFGCRRLMLDKRNRLTYFSFLTFYWMTAPCAWLYGIPIEAFTDLVTATKWNVCFLVLVSVWRVALMTRVLILITGEPVWLSLSRILYPAAFISMIGAASLIPIMGGVRVAPDEQIIVSAASITATVSLWLFVIFASLCLASLTRKDKTFRAFPWKKVKRPTGALTFAIISVGIWALVSLPLQMKVRKNYTLSQLIEKQDFAGAVAYASQFEKTDFSRIHYLPPNPHVRQGTYFKDLVAEFDGTEPAWLREEWLENQALHNVWQQADDPRQHESKRMK